MEGRRSLATAYDPEAAEKMKVLIEKHRKEMEEDKMRELRARSKS